MSIRPSTDPTRRHPAADGSAPTGAGAGAGTGAGTSAGTDRAAIDPVELAGGLRLSVTRLARRMRQAADMGLSPSLLSALAVVHVHGPMTLGALADHEGVSPPTVTKVVNRLEEHDLVERTVDEADRRVCRVVTTSAGEALLDSSRERKNAWLVELLAALDDEQLARLAGAADVLDVLAASEQR